MFVLPLWTGSTHHCAGCHGSISHHLRMCTLTARYGLEMKVKEQGTAGMGFELGHHWPKAQPLTGQAPPPHWLS